MKRLKIKNLLILFSFLTILSMSFTFNSAQSRVPTVNSLSDFWVRITEPFIALYTSAETNPNVRRIVKFGYNLDLDATPNEDVVSFGGQ